MRDVDVTPAAAAWSALREHRSCARVRRKRLRRTLACAVALTTCTAAPALAQTPTDWDTSPAVEQRVEALLAQMTLSEKVDLATGETNNFFGFYNNGNARPGIPARGMAEGPIGVPTPAPNVFEKKATALPAGLSLAPTGDPELARRYGDTMGDEAHRTNH